MAVFTSAYKALAHLAPNWDTQLRADMGVLELNLAQSTWTPSYSGPGVSLGTGGAFVGNVQRLGLSVKFNCNITIGSSASFGTGTLDLGGFAAYGVLAPTLSVGYGTYLPAGGGAFIPLQLIALSNSDMGVLVANSAGETNMFSLGTPGPGAQIRFTVDGVLST